MSRRRADSGPALSRPIRWEVIPKPGGAPRRLVVLSRADDVAFSRSVAGVLPAVHLALGSESHANRVVGWEPMRGPVLEPWQPARRRWQRDVRRLGSDAHRVAVTDVRACYASISPGVVTDRLRAIGASEACVHEIGSWLRVFGEAGVDGLPVGPAASALLADAVLSVGDDALRATGAAHVRWVDDVAIFAPDAWTRAAALEALLRAWASCGLEPNDAKTHLLDDAAGGARSAITAASPTASAALR
jgi:hypothetical protein